MRRFSVSIPFCLLIAVLWLLDLGGAFLPTFLAIVIHELGHIAAIKACGGTIERLDIKIFGAKIHVPELSLMSYGKEITIAAAGPAAGLLAAGGAFAAACVLKTNAFDFFIGVNIAITAINLIPVYPLDGGRIVLSGLLSLFSVRAAYAVAYAVSIISVAAMFSLCIALAMKGMLNPTLALFAGYIAICSITRRL